MYCGKELRIMLKINSNAENLRPTNIIVNSTSLHTSKVLTNSFVI